MVCVCVCVHPVSLTDIFCSSKNVKLQRVAGRQVVVVVVVVEALDFITGRCLKLLLSSLV